MHILHCHLWEEKFQMTVTGERQVTGGNGRGPSGQEGWRCYWIAKVFGDVISYGSGQLCSYLLSNWRH